MGRNYKAWRAGGTKSTDSGGPNSRKRATAKENHKTTSVQSHLTIPYHSTLGWCRIHRISLLANISPCSSGTPPSTDTEPLAQSACLLAAVSYRSKRSCRQPLYQYIILSDPSLVQNRLSANWYLLRYKRQHASPAPPPPPPPTSIGFAKCVQVRLAARRAYCTKISPGTFLKLSHDSINDTKGIQSVNINTVGGI